MLFKDFYKLYEQDMRSRLKQNTWEHKAHVIQSKILPYFGDKPMKDIQARDVLAWQNELLRHRDKNGKPYSETYLKNLHNQLSCIGDKNNRSYGRQRSLQKQRYI
ncbi:N-terminal phage integrase SAM-like domain-containing protein [Ruminococcus champanellensis]|uniref:N-terminal phage integrase SAM-like domain-containing protein n=1 Tax=Ruminococcus champanellensis TaxID=1161942 RepID=UPI0039F4F60D